MKKVKLFEQFLTEVKVEKREDLLESIDMDDLKNAKEKLSNPHTILDITYTITRKGDRFVRFDYENKHVSGKMVDSGPHFVKVFYGNDKDLKKISKELNMNLKESLVTEAKVDKKYFDKVVKILSKSKYPFTIMLVNKWDEIDIVIGYDAPDEIVDDIDQKLMKAKLTYGGGSGISISGDSSSYSRKEYDEIARINGGHRDY